MTKKSNTFYRPDIDGLRAFAILGVLIYHFFPNTLPGGFLGVDVFFVISGYLISKILIKSLENGTFSITTFYQKRIRRIFPALLIVGILFFVYGFFVLFPTEFQTLTRHLSNGAIFNVNHALYRDGGYFDTAITHKPFMHLWSLSVEEQFYILWPFVLWIFHKTNKLRWLLLFILIAISVSYGANVFYTNRNPDMAFYWLHTRFWEIATGALMAHLELNHTKRLSSPFGSVLGLLLIIGSFFFISYDVNHFVYWSLLPIIGSVLIVHNTAETFGSKILSLRPLVWVGLISYPLYILHWPLISFCSIIDPTILTIPIKLLLIGVSFLGAFLIYRFIENPIRKSQNKKTTSYLFTAMMTLALLSFFGAREFYNPWSFYQNPEIAQVEIARKDWGVEMDSVEYEGLTLQKLGKEHPTILFFGDSYMEEYLPRMCLLAKKTGIPMARITWGGRCPILNVARRLKTGGFDESRDFVKKALEYAKSQPIKTVVLSASWISYLSSGGQEYTHIIDDHIDFLGTNAGFEKTMKSLENMLKDIIQSGKKVYLILTKPYGHNPEAYFQRNYLGISKKNNSMHVPRADWDKYSKRVHARLREIAKTVGAFIIDPTPHFCDAHVCKNILNDGSLMYMDGGHLRASYVEEHVHFLDFLFDQ